MTLQATLLSPSELSESERQAWRAFQHADPALPSPLLTPDFAEAVASARSDAAVAVYRRGGRVVGFLAHHRRPGGTARPIGAIWSDCHALIAEPGARLDGAEALAAAGLGSFRFHGLLDPQRAFSAAPLETTDGYAISFEQDAEAYWESRRARSAKRFKNLRRLEHKLEREVGEIGFTGPERSAASLEQLFTWKRDQFRRTGRHDVLGSAWSQALMTRLFETQSGEFQGLLLSLTVGGRMVAGHFGVRSGSGYHPWIAAFDPALADYSPGWIFLRHAIDAMPKLGVSRYDLSGGHDHYKQPLAADVRPLASGVAHAAAPRPSVDSALALAGRALGRERQPLVARVRRRLDHIAAAEPSLGGRLQGLAVALSSGRRGAEEAEA